MTLAEPVSKARLRLWLRLLKATGGIEAELRRRLRDEHGTTLPRFDVMAALARHPEGLRMSALSAMLRVSGGNVTPIVDRLEADGLAERVAVPGDKRALVARLTRAGRAAFAVLAEAHEGWVEELLGGVDAGEAAQLGEALRRIERRVRHAG